MVYGILLLINIYLKLIFTLLALHSHILDCLFPCLSPYFPNFHILLHYLFFFLNNYFFLAFFNLVFLGAFTREGFTYFIYAIVYFFFNRWMFCYKNFDRVQCALPLKVFFTPIFQCQCLVTCHTQRLFFHGGSGSCDLFNFIWIFYTYV